ncbi:rho GTPase-activating protein 5-like [Rutidosis leptorrhynchoides]|uniref:rho GTPase-activating protein 5-like n=1 Tax=Rutidosis leptorrhynchoides TaxID=125765 RepID=UPI003A98E9D2
MTEVLHSPSSSSSSSSSSSLEAHDLTLYHPLNQNCEQGFSRVTSSEEENVNVNERINNNSNNNNNPLSLLALLLTLFRKSFWGSSNSEVNSNKNTVAEESLDLSGMEIGWPTDVRHVAHVTFDRFNGFLGLPVEFEPEVLRRAPSASATVFGVSTESMQLSYDSRGNSVPVILILMQERLYSLGGLQAEGIFRINPDNNQEEHLRNELNHGVVPDGIDVHCLAGLIKAWFRELPTGVLDPLAPEQVMQCQTEDDCFALCRLLPPTETALLNWAVNLMADVVQHEHLNKMNSHNIAMVFAPNMTQMADPLNALMYAVQVMNFLKSLIAKTLREREDRVVESYPPVPREPSDENGDQGPRLNPNLQETHEEDEESDGPDFCVWPGQTQSSNQEKDQALVDMSKGMINLRSINAQTERIEGWR